jgi:hypothetical protein
MLGFGHGYKQSTIKLYPGVAINSCLLQYFPKKTSIIYVCVWYANGEIPLAHKTMPTTGVRTLESQGVETRYKVSTLDRAESRH